MASVLRFERSASGCARRASATTQARTLLATKENKMPESDAVPVTGDQWTIWVKDGSVVGNTPRYFDPEQPAVLVEVVPLSVLEAVREERDRSKQQLRGANGQLSGAWSKHESVCGEWRREREVRVQL